MRKVSFLRERVCAACLCERALVRGREKESDFMHVCELCVCACLCGSEERGLLVVFVCVWCVCARACVRATVCVCARLCACVVGRRFQVAGAVPTLYGAQIVPAITTIQAASPQK